MGSYFCGKQGKLRNRKNSSCNLIRPVLHRTGLRRELSAARQPSDGLQPSKGRVTRRNGQALGAKQRITETLPLDAKISAIPASVKAKSPGLRVIEWRSMAARAFSCLAKKRPMASFDSDRISGRRSRMAFVLAVDYRGQYHPPSLQRPSTNGFRLIDARKK